MCKLLHRVITPSCSEYCVTANAYLTCASYRDLLAQNLCPVQMVFESLDLFNSCN